MTESADKKRRIAIVGREFESLQSAARAFSMSRNTLDYRLKKGWTPEQAVGLEPRPSHAVRTAGIPVSVQGQEFKSIKEAAKHYGRAYTHVLARLKEGCSIEQALGLIERTDSLQTEYPELSEQWHPTKNASLTADAVTPHSGQKVWWLCSHGHEWKAVINSRTRGYGCPYCAGQRPTAERNFATEYPDVVQDWDWDRNGSNKPESFTPRSASKVWWRCAKGHSWKATIANRTRGYKGGCPYCSNRKLCADNSLAHVHPEIAEDWHPRMNGSLTPRDVVAGGSKKVWWICKHGHEWQATVGLRVNAGTGCPKCTNQTSRIEIAVYAELCALFDAIEWREKVAGYECDILLCDRRIGIEVDGVFWHRRRPDLELAKSAAFEAEGLQLFRLREAGLPLLSERDLPFTWSDDAFPVVSGLAIRLLKFARLTDDQRSRLRDYIDGPGLVNSKMYRTMVANLPAPPPGHSLADKQPQIAEQWAYDLNAPLLPEHFRHQANKSVWWRCAEGHTWKVTINNRTQHGTGCPECPRPALLAPDEKNLAVVNPELASEWHPDNNGDLRPEDVWPKSNRQIWWQCGGGHEWRAVVASRAEGSGCPYCSGRYATRENNLASKHPELLAEWDEDKNEGVDPSGFTPRTNKKVWWRCADGHSWQASINNRAKLRSGCPVCAQAKRRKYSIEDMRKLAKERGGDCLSNHYTSSRANLEWRCKRGHVWEGRADGVIYAGKWCPFCAGNRSAQLDLKLT